MFLDKFLETSGVLAEPGTVSVRGTREIIEVPVGFPSNALGGNGGIEELDRKSVV